MEDTCGGIGNDKSLSYPVQEHKHRQTVRNVLLLGCHLCYNPSFVYIPSPNVHLIKDRALTPRCPARPGFLAHMCQLILFSQGIPDDEPCLLTRVSLNTQQHARLTKGSSWQSSNQTPFFSPSLPLSLTPSLYLSLTTTFSLSSSLHLNGPCQPLHHDVSDTSLLSKIQCRGHTTQCRKIILNTLSQRHHE